jgi:hypothetical protein
MWWVRVLVLGLIFLISCEQQLWEVDFVRLDDLWFHQFNLYSIGCLKLQKMPHLTLLVQDPIQEISRWCAPVLFCFWDANMVSVCRSEKGKKRNGNWLWPNQLLFYNPLFFRVAELGFALDLFCILSPNKERIFLSFEVLDTWTRLFFIWV